MRAVVADGRPVAHPPVPARLDLVGPPPQQHVVPLLLALLDLIRVVLDFRVVEKLAVVRQVGHRRVKLLLGGDPVGERHRVNAHQVLDLIQLRKVKYRLYF